MGEKPENNEVMSIIPPEVLEWIKLERVQIKEVTDTHYKVRYGGEEVTIAKSTRSYFVEGGGGSGGMGLTLDLRQKLCLTMGGIFQDKNAPDEFKTVMIFHELREREYKRQEMEKAHQRAVHDEILYVLKYLPPELHEAYFKWADAYRNRRKKTDKMAEEKVIETNRRRQELLRGMGLSPIQDNPNSFVVPNQSASQLRITLKPISTEDPSKSTHKTWKCFTVDTSNELLQFPDPLAERDLGTGHLGAYLHAIKAYGEEIKWANEMGYFDDGHDAFRNPSLPIGHMWTIPPENDLNSMTKKYDINGVAHDWQSSKPCMGLRLSDTFKQWLSETVGDLPIKDWAYASFDDGIQFMIRDDATSDDAQPARRYREFHEPKLREWNEQFAPIEGLYEAFQERLDFLKEQGFHLTENSYQKGNPKVTSCKKLPNIEIGIISPMEFLNKMGGGALNDAQAKEYCAADFPGFIIRSQYHPIHPLHGKPLAMADIEREINNINPEKSEKSQSVKQVANHHYPDSHHAEEGEQKL